MLHVQVFSSITHLLSVEQEHSCFLSPDWHSVSAITEDTGKNGMERSRMRCENFKNEPTNGCIACKFQISFR